MAPGGLQHSSHTRLPHFLGPCHVCGGYEPPWGPRRALTFMSGKITGLLVHETPIHGFWRGEEPWDPTLQERETHCCVRLVAWQARSQRQSQAPSPRCSSWLWPPGAGSPSQGPAGEVPAVSPQATVCICTVLHAVGWGVSPREGLVYTARGTEASGTPPRAWPWAASSHTVLGLQILQ